MNNRVLEEQHLKDLKRKWRSLGISSGDTLPYCAKDVGTGTAYFRIGNPNPLYNNSSAAMACMGRIVHNKVDWEFHKRS